MNEKLSRKELIKLDKDNSILTMEKRKNEDKDDKCYISHLFPVGHMESNFWVGEIISPIVLNVFLCKCIF